MDHSGLALPGRDPRSVLTPRDRLGDGAPADRGAGEQEFTGWAPAPLDRGSQYAATRYQLLLPTDGITTSMSRRGNCWDHAWVEHFFGLLKRERVYPRHDATRDDAKREIVEYREVVSNRLRRHSTLGDHSPAEYAARTTVRNQVSTESGKGQIHTCRMLETVFQDQTFIGMERQVCLDVTGMVQADDDAVLTAGTAPLSGEFWNRGR